MDSTERLRHEPALDGLRGLSLLAIVVYHAEVGVPGAFLSVSTFLTLSGFLITAVLLHERSRTGTTSLRGFWSRRLRRLMPASLAAIALIATAATVLGDPAQLDRLQADALAALGYVANWRFVLAGDSYGAIFESPSPFTHFWTLGIEEQFYVVFPLVVAGALAAGRGSHRVLAATFAVLAAASVAWSAWLFAGGSTLDRIYFGTDTRMAELLVGALAALWWYPRRDDLGRARRPVQVAGPVALVAMLVLWGVAGTDDTVFYRGGLVVYSLLTVVVMLAATQDGPVRRVLTLGGLPWVGVVSYGAYLVHWPILVWLHQHTGLSTPARLALGLAASLTIAAASHRWLERPVREGRRVRGERAWAAVPTAVGVTLSIVVLASALAVEEAASSIDFDAASDQLAGFADGAAPPTTGDGELTPEEQAALDHFFAIEAQRELVEASDAPRVATFGDSTALMTGLGLAEWAFDNYTELVPWGGWAELGCGLLTDVERRFRGQVGGVLDECVDWLDEWRAEALERRPAISVVQLGPWDVLDQRVGGSGAYLAIGDPTLDALLAERLSAGIDALLEGSELVVLLLPPDIEAGRVDGRSPAESYPESDPARMARFRALLEAEADADPRVITVDLAGWVEAHDDRRLRPDGIHFTEETTKEVAAWLGPELARRYAETVG